MVVNHDNNCCRSSRRGLGLGYNINIPLRAGLDGASFRRGLEAALRKIGSRMHL